ncbi:hypothetical protein [Arsukibacterium indicum]|uniref:Beta-ketoacyl synthase N-terminal domain-containing protein n=1 Tax=Arsukibacterium indicum TaxID=2848612 RepID=A0ABS6MMA4_9GAMM|nr:hypothetical protein [Arsukibacterium indicum]MBV2129705.1 hypothetical protein [Arsukibacterium indicum]
MASCIALKQHAVIVGKTSDTDWALQLDVMPVDPILIQQAGQLRQVNTLSGIDAALPFNSRLLAMLTRLLAQFEPGPANAPVLLVLPELLANETVLSAFVQQLRQQFPTLLSHGGCQLFPYGRSAGLMALSAARQLLESGEPVVWIIGLDSPVALLQTMGSELSASAAQQLISEDQQVEQVVWSEGAIGMALQHSDTGLSCQYLASDATVGNDVDELALAQLFKGAASQAGSSMAQLYMPDNGLSELTACWQPHYLHLAPVISKTSQLCFPAYTTGELGAAGGLYRFLLLYLSYSNASQSGLSLQCEISERLYRAVAVFSWQNAGSLSEN